MTAIVWFFVCIGHHRCCVSFGRPDSCNTTHCHSFSFRSLQWTDVIQWKKFQFSWSKAKNDWNTSKTWYPFGAQWLGHANRHQSEIPGHDLVIISRWVFFDSKKSKSFRSLAHVSIRIICRSRNAPRYDASNRRKFRSSFHQFSKFHNFWFEESIINSFDRWFWKF